MYLIYVYRYVLATNIWCSGGPATRHHTYIDVQLDTGACLLCTLCLVTVFICVCMYVCI